MKKRGGDTIKNIEDISNQIICHIDGYDDTYYNELFYSDRALCKKLDDLLRLLKQNNEEIDGLDDELQKLVKNYQSYRNHYMSDKLSDDYRRFLEEINKAPLLTSSEEKELSQRIKQGDMEAKKRFIESNYCLVYSIVNKYHLVNLTYLDLFQEGVISLMKAVDAFSPEYGCRFSSFAYTVIGRDILRVVQKYERLVKIPHHKLNKMRKINTFENDYYLKHGQMPSLEVISKELKLDVDLILELKTYSFPSSLDDELKSDKEDNPTVLIDLVKDKTNIEDEVVDKLTVEEFLKVVNPKEAEVLKMRCGIDYPKAYTQKEIAKMFGVSHQRICFIENQAIGKIKKKIGRW